MAFAKPVEASGRFWVAFDLHVSGSQGVHFSFEASTGGTHSRGVLPGIKPKGVDFGDWRVEVVLKK